MDRKLTLYILLGMMLGVVVGQALNQLVPAEVIKADIAPSSAGVGGSATPEDSPSIWISSVNFSRYAKWLLKKQLTSMFVAERCQHTHTHTHNTPSLTHTLSRSAT